ncbi:MAG: hypothetical protein AAGF24_04625, partial [Cyanobacteria bacterium P01_H01_bin.121]
MSNQLATAIALGFALSLSGMAPALAQTPEPVTDEPERIRIELERSDVFWTDVTELTEAQIRLLNRLEEAVDSADPNRVRVAEGQTLLHLVAVERFLERYFGAPESLCGLSLAAAPIPSDFTAEGLQRDAYCTFAASIPDLEALLQPLTYRLLMLASVAEVKPLPLVSGENVMTAAGIPRFER